MDRGRTFSGRDRDVLTDLLMSALSGDASQISKGLVEKHCRVIQQLNSQLNVLRKMKQNTLRAIKPKRGSLP